MKIKNLSKGMLSLAIVFALTALIATSCNKYDKMSILGSWEVDIKAAKGLAVDSCKEILTFDSGSKQLFTQNYMLRSEGKYTRWTVIGTFERKHNTLYFYDQIRDDGEKIADVQYKYKIDGDKLILQHKDFESEGYTKGEKIFTKKTSL